MANAMEKPEERVTRDGKMVRKWNSCHWSGVDREGFEGSSVKMKQPGVATGPDVMKPRRLKC
jgi:hypothetical protein